jgi:hypothetical protein
MRGKGFLTHLGKDRFEVSNVGIGRDFKKIQIKLLKKDMQDILKKYGRDNTGNKDEIIRKFVEFAKKVPKLWNPAQAPAQAKPSKLNEIEVRVNRMIKKLEEREPITQPKSVPEFIPLEEAVPQIQSKPKITPFTPLEEAVPQFQSKNIKIQPKPATAVVYRSITRPRVIQPEPVPEPAQEIKENLKSTVPEKVLGLPKNPTMDQIKQNYRQLSRKYHPDRTKSTKEQQIINRAYETLTQSLKPKEEQSKIKEIFAMLKPLKIKGIGVIREFFDNIKSIKKYEGDGNFSGIFRRDAIKIYPKLMEILEKNNLREVALLAEELLNTYAKE